MALVQRRYPAPAIPFSQTAFVHRRLTTSQAKQTNMPTSKQSFLFSQPWDPKASTRKKELELAAQRSHSARVASDRRKRLRQQQTQPADEALPFSTSHSSEEDGSGNTVDQTSDQLVTTGFVLATGPLTHGSSDPFNAYATPVNSQLHRMIAFARHSYYPSLSIAPWLRREQHSLDDGLRFFELGRGTPESTVAHLTSYGAAFIRLLDKADKQDLRKAWLHVRAQALQTLRKALPDQDRAEPFAIPLMQQCLYLFQGDVEARIFSSASIHAKTLRFLFKPQPPTPRTIFLYLTSMHSTLETAVFPLQPPLMTFEDWQPAMWHGIWNNAEAMLAALSPPGRQDLHADIKFSLVRETQTRMRLYFLIPALDHSSNTPEQRARTDLTSLWSATRLVNDAMILLTRFLELTRSSQVISEMQMLSDTSSTKDQLWESTLTLAAFCTIRHHAHSPFLDDTSIDLRDASYILAPELRRTVERLLADLSQPEWEEGGELLFWVFFVGAINEQRKGSLYRHQVLENIQQDQAQGGRGYWYFTEKLAQQGKILGLRRWNDARTLLERFAAYGEGILRPDPKLWYETIFG